MSYLKQSSKETKPFLFVRSMDYQIVQIPSEIVTYSLKFDGEHRVKKRMHIHVSYLHTFGFGIISVIERRVRVKCKVNV